MTAPSPTFAASIASLSEAFAVRVVGLLLSATVADVQAFTSSPAWSRACAAVD